MNDNDLIMCDACGLTFPPSHMADSFVGQDLCAPCDADIAADMPDPEPWTDAELDAYADVYHAQWDDDPNPYHGNYSEE